MNAEEALEYMQEDPGNNYAEAQDIIGFFFAASNEVHFERIGDPDFTDYHAFWSVDKFLEEFQNDIFEAIPTDGPVVIYIPTDEEESQDEEPAEPAEKMTAQQAVEYMQQPGNDNYVCCDSWTGVFCIINDRVYFSCPGEYPCCHDDQTIEEFLEEFKNEEFERA